MMEKGTGNIMNKIKTQRNNKRIIGLSVLLIALIALMAIFYINFKPKTTIGAKELTIQVFLENEVVNEYVYNTDQEFLRGALEEAKLIKGIETDFGLMVTEVDDVKVDDSKQEWWCFTKDKEMLMTGVDSTPINDGDHFEITFTVGY